MAWCSVKKSTGKLYLYLTPYWRRTSNIVTVLLQRLKIIWKPVNWVEWIELRAPDWWLAVTQILAMVLIGGMNLQVCFKL